MGGGENDNAAGIDVSCVLCAVESFVTSPTHAEKIPMLRSLVAFAFLLAAAQSFQVAAPTVARRNAVSARMQFGTGNYDESQTKKNFVLSPIAGVSKDYGESRFEESPGGELEMRTPCIEPACGVRALPPLFLRLSRAS